MSAATHTQRGVALLVALLVVALATVLIAGLLDRGELTAARTRNALRATQARAYAQGLEAYAATVLTQDSEHDGRVDTADDVWALPLAPTPVPGGEISATMRDLNGRFNLNNLDPSESNPNAGFWFGKFGLLLHALKLDPTLADNVQAWMSTDPAAAGAADAYYLQQPVAYRAARREFAHVSELRLVKGVDGDVYAKLAPYVCALPPRTTININTASVPVLMTLATADGTLTEEMARTLWQQGHAKFGSIDDVRKLLPGFAAQENCSNCYGFTSHYFLARGDIVLDDLPFTFFSVLERRPGTGVRVIQRSRGADY